MRANATRRRLIVLALSAFATSRVAAALRPNARIGYLEHAKASDGERLYREFVEAMQSHGYATGRNLTIVRRSADLETHRLRPFAAEMAAARLDVIVATTIEAAKAAKVAAPRVPTVFVAAGDPVHEGLVASIARPGGLITGVVTRGADLTAKRLQLLRDAFPRVSSVAVVGSNVAMARAAHADAAQRLGLAIQTFAMNDPVEYRDAAAAIARSAAEAVLVVQDADEVTNLNAFTRVMMATRRPVMFNADVFVEAEGWGLMAYGVSLRERYRRVAAITARVLEGAKPGEIPVEQPTRYELVVNQRSADEYGIALPREFVERADRVIR